MTSKTGSFLFKDLVRKGAPVTEKLPPMQGVPFGTVFTPHMLTIDWTAEKGWEKPVIDNFKPLPMSPAASGLNYGLQCFEGMKAYRNGSDGTVRMFRPDMNAKRLMRSHERLGFPTFDVTEFVECLSELVSIDREWIPTETNYSLYIRPTSVSTTPSLELDAPSAMKHFIIMSPVGPYYPSGFKPVKLLVQDKAHRAWPGGHGSFKVGPNYAAPCMHQINAGKQGYGQVLWLGPGDVVDEVGAMNFLMLWTNEEGKRELLTPPLDGTILPGITRDSILNLAKDEVATAERRFTVHDVVKGLKEGRVEEIFGCGTAAIVTVVDALSYRGEELPVPAPEDSFAKRMMNKIIEIQTTGVADHPWVHMVQ